MPKSSLIQRDANVIWHPYTQMKTAPPHIPITKAKDTLLYTESGEVLIDAISSWWVNIHGHGNPVIQQKIAEQVKTLDHIIFAGFTHEPAIELAEKLLMILPPNQEKVFYSDNGSTAVEIGLKMAIQYWANRQEKKTRVIAFENSYHGDTFGAMSVGARSTFTSAFNDFLFEVDFLNLNGTDEEILNAFEEMIHDNTAAFIFEPLVQGAGGMLMHTPHLLDQLLRIAKSHNLITIADEVMTGFGRTGKWFASLFLQEEPDILCLSKGITGGVLPLAATTCTQEIYHAFLSEDKTKALFHGHSYTANPIAIAAALGSFQLLMQSRGRLEFIEKEHRNFLNVLKQCPDAKNPRLCGTILAFDVKSADETSYFNRVRDQLYEHFISKGVLLRPLGNTVYILPPYCITKEELDRVYAAITGVLN